MKTELEHYKTALVAINEIEDPNKLAQLFEVALSRVTIGSIQEIADIEGKTYQGIRDSKRYKKIKLMGKTKVILGTKKEDNFPF